MKFLFATKVDAYLPHPDAFGCGVCGGAHTKAFTISLDSQKFVQQEAVDIYIYIYIFFLKIASVVQMF
jgi:hypothetical protein